MMNVQHLFAVGNIAAVASIAWVLFHWLYRDYRIDKYREELFALRDELFDLARSGTVPFHHPAYGMLRSTMNGSIRFAHRLNLVRVLILAAVHLKSDDARRYPDYGHLLEAKADDLSASARHGLLHIYYRLGFYHIKHLILTSMVLWLLILPLLFLAVVAILFAVGAGAVRYIRFDLVNEEAGELGETDLKVA